MSSYFWGGNDGIVGQPAGSGGSGGAGGVVRGSSGANGSPRPVSLATAGSNGWVKITYGGNLQEAVISPYVMVE